MNDYIVGIFVYSLNPLELSFLSVCIFSSLLLLVIYEHKEPRINANKAKETSSTDYCKTGTEAHRTLHGLYIQLADVYIHLSAFRFDFEINAVADFQERDETENCVFNALKWNMPISMRVSLYPLEFTFPLY